MKNDAENVRVGLLGIGGVYAGAAILADKTPIVIGRDPRLCNLILSGKRISRKHCSIWYDFNKGMYVITDYSMNGVFTETGERLKRGWPILMKHEKVLYIATPENSFKLI